MSDPDTALRWPRPPLVEGPVRLRAWTRADVRFIVAACADPEVSRYSPAIPFPYRAADALGWLASQEPARLQGRLIDFAVVDALTGAPLGAIGLLVHPRLNLGEAGYWLALEARGHGYMSHALGALMRWAFTDLGLARLQLTTDPENLASQAVARRCGFQLEGQMRSHMLILHSGLRRDSLMWGLLPDDPR